MSQIDANYRNVNFDQATGTGGVDEKPGANATTMGDVQGTPDKTPPTTPRPTLPAPSMSPTAMMIALTALQSKMAEEGIKFGEKSMDGVRTDIKQNAEKRAEQLKKYFEDLDRSLSKRCGFFGLIAKFFKAVFTGDWKGVVDALKDVGSILKDIAQIVAVAVAIAAAAALTVASGGAGAGLLAAAIVGAVLVIGGMAMTDPGIMEMIMEALPEDQRQAAAIALAVVGAVLALAGGIVMGAATGGASALATISTVTTAISGLISAGVTVDQGVKGYQAAEHRAGALRNQAEMDISDARMADLKGLLDRSQKDLKAMYEAFANALSSTREMITTYGQNQSRAASV